MVMNAKRDREITPQQRRHALLRRVYERGFQDGYHLRVPVPPLLDEEAAAEYRRGLRIGRKQRAAASCPYCGRLCSGSACAEHIDLIRAERAQVR
jgi:hypothetical protein